MKTLLLSLVASLVLCFSGTLFAQGPALPDGLAQDSRLTWRPVLLPTATLTVSSGGKVTLWRSGAPVDIPTAGREPLIVAIEQLKNDAGEWVGFFGHQAAVSLGDKTDANDSARSSGFSGISIVGLDDDPSSSDWSVLPGFMLSQRIGLQRDIAFLNLAIDSWTDRPCQTVDGNAPSMGNLYLENIRGLGVSNNLKGKTAKGDGCTKWFFKLHGAWRLHLLRFSLEDGVDVGDGLAGCNEHGVYEDALIGDSEVLDCTFHGCKISAFYDTTRYQNRIQIGTGYVERYSKGKLLIDNLFAHDCGELGSWAVNLCGGLQDVTVRNMHYRVNLDDPTAPAKWAGGALQIYVDAKQYELDYSVPVNSNSVPVKLGYSLEKPSVLPMSDSLPQELLDNWDGFGGARSLTVIGGTFEGSGIYPPLFNLRDVKRVAFIEATAGTAPFHVSGVGKTIAFAASGISSQCGPAQAVGSPPGKLPQSFGQNWNQQAVFLTRRRVSTVFGSVKVDGTVLTATDLETWSGHL